ADGDETARRPRAVPGRRVLTARISRPADGVGGAAAAPGPAPVPAQRSGPAVTSYGLPMACWDPAAVWAVGRPRPAAPASLPLWRGRPRSAPPGSSRQVGPGRLAPQPPVRPVLVWLAPRSPREVRALGRPQTEPLPVWPARSSARSAGPGIPGAGTAPPRR